MRRPWTLASLLLLSAVAVPAKGALRPRTTIHAPGLIPVDPARVADALARADAAAQEGRMREARRIYQDLVRDQVAADQFAGTAMWRLALNYLYSDDPRRAAEQLDELAGAAARYGDPKMQLRATFEAAALWQKLRRPDLVVERVDRVRALLQSPAIPADEKASIRQRMQ